MGKLKLRRPLSTLAVSSVALAGVPFITPAMASAQACTPVHVISVPGTGASHSNAPTEPRAIAPNYNLTKMLQDRVGANSVSGWTTNYPSSVGAVSMFWGVPTGSNYGTEMASYGESVKIGVNNTNKHLSRYKAACPNTKFIIMGYSQGASVAGDVARDIGNGRVQGVTSDDVSNVVLIADPGRASTSEYDSYTGDKSTLYGPIPPGKMGKNFEIIAPEANPKRIGWTGEREGRFKGMYGKVLSLCDDADLACSAPPNSILRALADYANVESGVNMNSNLGKRITDAVKVFTDNGGIQALQRGDLNRVNQLLASAMGTAKLGPADIPAALALVREVISIAGKIQPKCGEIDLGETLGYLVVSTLPQLARDQLNMNNINTWLNTFNVQVPPQIQQVIDMANSNPMLKDVANKALSLVGGLVADAVANFAARQLGIENKDPKTSDLQSFGEQAAYLVGFGSAHSTYWGNNTINGKPSAIYAVDWMAESARNVIAGKSHVAQPKGNALNDPNREIALEDQVGEDGGVICDPDEFGPDNDGEIPGDGGGETPGENPDDPGTGETPGDEPGTGETPGDEPGAGETPEQPGDEPGSGETPETPGDDPGTGETPGDEPGTETPDQPGEDTGSEDIPVKETGIFGPVRIATGNSIDIPAPSDVVEGTTFSSTVGTPDWVTINPDGSMTIAPGEDVDPGTYSIPVLVTDPEGNQHIEHVEIRVDKSGEADPAGTVPSSTDNSRQALATTGASVVGISLAAVGMVLLAGAAAMFGTRRRQDA